MRRHPADLEVRLADDPGLDRLGAVVAAVAAAAGTLWLAQWGAVLWESGAWLATEHGISVQHGLAAAAAGVAGWLGWPLSGLRGAADPHHRGWTLRRIDGAWCWWHHEGGETGPRREGEVAIALDWGWGLLIEARSPGGHRDWLLVRPHRLGSAGHALRAALHRP